MTDNPVFIEHQELVDQINDMLRAFAEKHFQQTIPGDNGSFNKPFVITDPINENDFLGIAIDVSKLKSSS